MAQLPGEMFLMQQIGEEVILFHRYTEEEVVRYPVKDRDATAKSQKIIHDSTALNDEEKTFAHFWSGYFYANSTIYTVMESK